MSAFNPFRANPLSPTSTGASVSTVTSYNPPPSFHSVARDDETTVYFDDVDELPVITEESEGSELSRSGTVTSTGTWREEETGTRTPTSQTPLIDLNHSLPTTPTMSPRTPEIRIQIEEPPLPPLPLSPRSTGSRSRSGTRTRTEDDDNVDFPAPRYPDDLPPAYTPAPDFNHGEATLEVGPRRPFQQVQQSPRTVHLSAPTPTNLASTPTGQANNASSSPASPGSLPSRPFSSLNRGRRGRLGVIQQWTEQIFDQLEQVTNSAGVGNLRSSPGTGTGASSTAILNNRPSQAQVPRHARSFSDLGSRTGATGGGGGRLSPVPPALPPRLSPNPTGGSTHSTNSVNTVNTRSSDPTSGNSNTSIPSNASSDFARDFYAAGTGEGLLDLDPSSDDEDDVPLGLRRARSGASVSGDVRSRSFEGLGTSSTPNVLSGSTSTASNGATDDDRPTTSPVPGRALLKDGKILVYPKGFTCPKCFNIGYKRNDPKNPCKKCWKKYAKPYSPVMSYAPDAGATTTLQRPLPKPTPTPSSLSVPGGGVTTSTPNSLTRPTTLRRPPQPSLHRSTPSVPNLNASAYGSNTMPGGFPPSPTLRTTPTGGSQCTHPFHSRNPSSPVIPTCTLQPQRTGGGPSAVVYSAGDPRLGGMRCWQCGGTGTVSYLFFDNSVCMECSGIGRVYR